jgi:hypothetical protein
MTILRVFAAAVLLATAVPTHAQQPLSVGTAAGLGGTAVTESRRSDAVTWNPALVGIYDGPFSSYSALALDVDVLPARGWAGATRALGMGPATPADGEGGRVLPRGGAAAVAGRIQWLGTQHRDLALSIATHHVVAGAVPDSIALVLGAGGGVSSPAPVDSTVRSTATVLVLARGMHLRRLPLLGSVWFGGAAKGWWVHSYARGAFLAREPGEDVYRETVIRDVPGYGVDLGLAAQPTERVRLGLAVANVFSGALRPERGPRVRTVSILSGADGRAEVTETRGPHLSGEDDGTEEATLARRLWQSTAYPAVLRGGGSVETDAGAVSAALVVPLREGGLRPLWDESPYSVAYAGPGSLPIRASYAWGGEGRTWSAGIAVGSCERRWSAAVVRRSTPAGAVFGASASVSVGSATGCDVFR